MAWQKKALAVTPFSVRRYVCVTQDIRFSFQIFQPVLNDIADTNDADYFAVGNHGMISVKLEGTLDSTRRFLERCSLFALAESLGGVESLIEHPALMTHGSVPPDVRAQLGIGDTLVRLSVGIEDADDLMADIEQALAAI